MNVIVDSYRIFSIDNNGNADFSFFAFDSLFELVLKRKILCTDNSGNQTEKQDEWAHTNFFINWFVFGS